MASGWKRSVLAAGGSAVLLVASASASGASADDGPGPIKNTRTAFKDGKVKLRWSPSKRANVYRVRITRLAFQVVREPGTTNPMNPVAPLPRLWQETHGRSYAWTVDSGARYRVQVRGVNKAGKGPITAKEFVAP
ncbi:MAG: hypothetical protein R2720_04300 [Candidatus Nanopelagicales bacterium]